MEPAVHVSRDPIGELQAEAAVLATARRALAPHMRLVGEAIPAADELLIAIVVKGQLIVASSSRTAFVEPMERWTQGVRREESHDRHR